MKLFSILFVVLFIFACSGDEETANLTADPNNKTAGQLPAGQNNPQGTNNNGSTILNQNPTNDFGIQVVSFEPNPSTIVELGGTTKIVFKVVNGSYKANSFKFAVNDNMVNLTGTAGFKFEGDPANSATITFPNNAETLNALKFHNQYQNQMLLSASDDSGKNAEDSLVLGIKLDDPNILSYAEDQECECGKPCIEFLTLAPEDETHDQMCGPILFAFNADHSAESSGWGMLETTKAEIPGKVAGDGAQYSLINLTGESADVSDIKTKLGIGGEEAAITGQAVRAMVFSEQSTTMNLTIASNDEIYSCYEFISPIADEKGNTSIPICEKADNNDSAFYLYEDTNAANATKVFTQQLEKWHADGTYAQNCNVQ